MINAVDQAFHRALTFTLHREGVDLATGDTGFVDNPNDPGGRTNYGITQGTYDAYRSSRNWPVNDVRQISLGEVEEIYNRNYWHDARCDLFAGGRPLLAIAHFDAAVNLGIRQAAKCLQRAIGAHDDGSIGADTLARISVCDEPKAIAAYLDDRAAVYRAIVERNPKSKEFLAGWLARCRWVARETGVPIGASYAQGGAA